MGKKQTHVNIYHGYGHTDNLVIYGHVLKSMPARPAHYSRNPFYNLLHLLRLFFVKPAAFEKVRMQWQNQVFDGVTAEDGFFKFEWTSEQHVIAGWHELKVAHISDNNEILAENTGSVFVPHITQYAFVSDIDDTVMISYSATVLRRLWELFVKNARTRKIFPGLAEHYSKLAISNTQPDTPNPFFYVSSSEWNLYQYLLEVFRHNDLPMGTFLLSQIKRWTQLLKTGKTKHEAKLLRIIRILEAFPGQQFVLFGDNTQSDPFIYEDIEKKYPGKIHAIYLRNISKEKAAATQLILDGLQQKGVHSLLYNNSEEAIAHSVKIGLISKEVEDKAAPENGPGGGA